MPIVHISKDNFDTEVTKSEKVVLLDFFAEWCGPCKMIAPVLEEIAAENEHIKVCKIDVDEAPDLARQFKVTSIPLLVVMKDGQIVNQALGARSKDAILKLIP